MRPTAPALVLLPALALLPVLLVVLNGAHGGGAEILGSFVVGAVSPSLDPALLQALLVGLQVTVATALTGWSCSLVFGVLLGSLSCERLWLTWCLPAWPATLLRRLMALPRSVHELIWGLLLLQVLGLHPWVAVLAISIPYSCLIARVWRDQLQSLDPSRLQAMLQTGSSPMAACMTALSPVMGSVLVSYGGYRLECALRSATLLGVFGLGGLGMDLELSLKSLQFHELWTGLWLLTVVTIALEQGLRCWRGWSEEAQFGQRRVLWFALAVLLSGGLGAVWLADLFPDSGSLSWLPVQWPDFSSLQQAALELPWLSMLWETLILTLLAAGIAIGLPPLLLLFTPARLWQRCVSGLWVVVRVIPPPLAVLLLLLSNQPTLAIGALALGLHNSGVMGRLLQEGLEEQDRAAQVALASSGASPQVSWLYGLLSPRSPSHLAYGAYRSDVILRETVVVGLIGGSGLGWQLLESLSSFHWAAVLLLITTYAALTLLGEWLSDRSRQHWLQS
jgi:phosphonate transport system permease protein